MARTHTRTHCAWSRSSRKLPTIDNGAAISKAEPGSKCKSRQSYFRGSNIQILDARNTSGGKKFHKIAIGLFPCHGLQQVFTHILTSERKESSAIQCASGSIKRTKELFNAAQPSDYIAAVQLIGRFRTRIATLAARQSQGKTGVEWKSDGPHSQRPCPRAVTWLRARTLGNVDGNFKRIRHAPWASKTRQLSTLSPSCVEKAGGHALRIPIRALELKREQRQQRREGHRDSGGHWERHVCRENHLTTESGRTLLLPRSFGN